MRNSANFDLKEERKMRHSRQTGLSRFFTAIIFIAAGGILIAEQTGYLSNDMFQKLFNWQMLLIGIGLVSASKRDGSIGGAIMIMIGLVFLAPMFFEIPLNTRQLLWPAVLIGIGLIILFNGLGRYKSKLILNFNKRSINDIDTIDGNHIFGGGDHFVTSDNFKGGRVNAIFGGGTYNLTRCKLAPGTNILELTLIFGGIELLIPSEWNVKVEVDSIMGGFSNKNGGFMGNHDGEGVLIIRGTAILGGGELKRV